MIRFVKRAATVFIAFLVLGLACATAPQAERSPWHEVPNVPDGRYLVFPPLEPPGEKTPLLFALHGWGGEALSYGRLWHEALQGGYLVVAPQATPKPRGGAAVSTWSTSKADRDYLLQVWDEIHRDYRIDPERTVVVGYSAGGLAAAAIVENRNAEVAAVIFHACRPYAKPALLKGKHVFLLAGERDTSFNAKKAGAALAELTAQGVDVRLAVAPGVSHVTVYDKVKDAARWVLGGFAAPTGE